MSTSGTAIKKITFNDKLLSLINKPSVHIGEIDALLEEELHLVSIGDPLEKLTQLIHLVSFIKTKNCSNPAFAIQVFVNQNTTPETRQALIDALMMMPKEDNKIYDFICLLAQHNKLERYTQISTIPSNPFSVREEHYNQWYFIFDLFGLCKDTPHELIPIIAQLFITTSPSIEDLLAFRTFLKTMDELHLLRKDILEMMLPLLPYKRNIEKLELFMLNLQRNELLLPDILEQVLPLLTHLDTLKNFFTIYQQELKLSRLRSVTLEKLHPFCHMSQPEKDSYDDAVSTNTPLHQAIIERNLSHVNHALALANAKLLLTPSYGNTALLLACKLADKEAARLILAKMQELGCEINQADTHGMTALHWAKFYHFEDLCAALLEAGANDHLKTMSGKNVEYFSRHQFTLDDLKIAGPEIIEGSFKLKNAALTDISFHAEKIALNLKLTSPDEVMTLLRSDESAYIRSSNRFYLFFKTFRPKLVEWLDKQRELDYQSSFSSAGPTLAS